MERHKDGIGGQLDLPAQPGEQMVAPFGEIDRALGETIGVQRGAQHIDRRLR